MRGQYFSFDAIIASVIFILALVALLSYWHSVRSFLDSQNDPMTTEMIRISDLLFLPSSPSGVTCGSISHLGLGMTFNDSRVNWSVVQCAAGQTPGWVMSKLGTPYNVSIKITRSDGVLETVGGDIPTGQSAPLNVVKMERLSTVVESDGSTSMAKFEISLYK